MWPNLVRLVIWVHEIAGSNPVIPTGNASNKFKVIPTIRWSSV